MKVLNTDNQVWGGLLYNVPKELKRYGGVYIISPYSSPANKNTSTSQSLLLSGTDFSSIINIASLKTWICTQLGYTEA